MRMLLVLLILSSCSPISMEAIRQEVIQDALDAYHLAEKSGDKFEICVKVGMVAEAYSQAKQEQHYLIYKASQKIACEKVR